MYENKRSYGNFAVIRYFRLLALLNLPRVSLWLNGECFRASIIVGGWERRGDASTRLGSVVACGWRILTCRPSLCSHTSGCGNSVFLACARARRPCRRRTF